MVQNRHAYVQSRLGGTESWVRIPKDRWPSEWTGKFRKPVVLLKLALYGHPDAGGYWESHCKDRLIAGGFTPVSDWNSIYWHSKLKMLLMVYVDDFKMSGPCENMNMGWKLIRTSIKPTSHRCQANAWVVTASLKRFRSTSGRFDK